MPVYLKQEMFYNWIKWAALNAHKTNKDIHGEKHSMFKFAWYR